MRRYLFCMTLAIASCGGAASAVASDWMFRPSTYSHNPMTGARVAQYEPVRTSYYRADSTYMESGYRQIRSALRGADGSYDYQHIVQTWGLGDMIRPYGEWEYPYRAGATPFGPWGNSQGPWTLPFDSWRNPYGLGQLRNSPWYLYNPWESPLGGNWSGMSPPSGGWGQGDAGGWGPGGGFAPEGGLPDGAGPGWGGGFAPGVGGPGMGNPGAGMPGAGWPGGAGGWQGGAPWQGGGMPGGAPTGAPAAGGAYRPN